MPHFDDVSVVTMTLAGEETAAALRDSLEALSRLRLRVAVADGGSPEGFLADLRRLPGFDVQSIAQPTLVTQVVAALVRARQWQTPYILYTEPDKSTFFSMHLASFLTQALSEPPVGVALAARSVAALDSFPRMQRTTETCLNTLCGTMTGVATDYTYGPFLADTALLRHVEDAAPGLGWGWRTFLFGRAASLGFRISGITGEFLCPPPDRQDTDADQIHRMRQLIQNVGGLIDAAGRTT